MSSSEIEDCGSLRHVGRRGDSARMQPETPGRKRKPDAENGKEKKEKEDREEIFEALAKLGHEPFYQVVDGRTQSLAALAKCEQDLVFNLTESYAGDDTKDMNMAAYLDLMGFPTRARAARVLLAQDKLLPRRCSPSTEVARLILRFPIAARLSTRTIFPSR